MVGRFLITISKNAMEAGVTMVPDADQELTGELLRQELAAKGICAGIREDMLEELTVRGRSYVPYKIAEGKPAVRARDGYYEYFFKKDTGEESPGYSTRSGMLDSLKVKKGDKVAQYHAPVPGENGYTVLGTVIAPVDGKPGKEPKCIGVERRGDEFFALENGFLFAAEDRIEVSDCYRVEEAGYVAPHKAHPQEKDAEVIPLILLVDDDPVMLRTEYGYLHGKYRVAAVSKPEDALRFLAKNTPDLILLDYLMPKINGGQMLKAIRASNNPRCASLPVFFLTSVTDKTVMNECLNLYPQGYLLKPIAKTELLGIIDEFLNQNE